jgi:hypothetical protein
MKYLRERKSFPLAAAVEREREREEIIKVVSALFV